jgi:hypothetical protein
MVLTKDYLRQRENPHIFISTTQKTTNSQTGSGIFTRISANAPNPVKYTDPDGREDELNIAQGVDINLFNPNTWDAIYVSRVSHPEGTFIVAGHANPLFMTDERDGDEHLVLPADLANMIKSHPNYKTGATIVLLACNAGKADESGLIPLAQLVADELGSGTVVKAADDYVHTDSNGIFFIGPNIPDNKNYFLDRRFKLIGTNYQKMGTFTGRTSLDEK